MKQVTHLGFTLQCCKPPWLFWVILYRWGEHFLLWGLPTQIEEARDCDALHHCVVQNEFHTERKWYQVVLVVCLHLVALSPTASFSPQLRLALLASFWLQDLVSAVVSTLHQGYAEILQRQNPWRGWFQVWSLKWIAINHCKLHAGCQWGNARHQPFWLREQKFNLLSQ